MTVHLHVQSCYSLLDSTIRIRELVSQAKTMGYKAVALTDHRVMSGMAAFLHACTDAGIKPIAGLQADCDYHGSTVTFLLICGDNIGYQNLMKLSSILCTQDAPCTLEQLQQACHHNTLIVYGEGGWMDHVLLSANDHRREISEMLAVLQEDFPSFYVALSYQESALWNTSNRILKNICRSRGIRTVALNKIFYLQEEDVYAYQALQAIAAHGTLQDPGLSLQKGRSFLSPQQMEALYDQDDLDATEEIAAMCTADYRLPPAGLPAFPVPAGFTSRTYLEQLCKAGLNKRMHGHVTKEYADRLRMELGVIEHMHFEDYFLIVYDYVRFGRTHGILIGPGRGSAAGSLVAYCLGITMVDPIPYHLLFERFLNPERVSMPDIDTDFMDTRRQEVIDYVAEKYGHDHVGNILTFQNFGAKAALRDTARLQRMSQNDIDFLIRQIPSSTVSLTLQQAYDQKARFRQLVTSEKKYADVYALAKKIEGLPRNMSIHPAGVILSGRKLSEEVPLIDMGSGLYTSQYEMGYLQERGLIKMDLLSLRNLTTIDNIVKHIQKQDPDFSLKKMSLEDSRIYALFAKGDTAGVFQFESQDMKRLLRQMQPKCFEDIVAAIALLRPGAMGHINEYMENRKHPEKIQYPSPALKPVLSDTYGIMLYQEQTMLTAQIAAGFTPGRADLLRKAISKKNAHAMAEMKNDFLQGCLHHGYTQKGAEALWATIETFGAYGFNKSHSVAYAVISCQMAWLKAVYPRPFYSCLLDSVVIDSRKSALYIDECRRKGIEIYPPCINRSKQGYTDEGKGLRMPLNCVKDVGRSAVSILDEREKNGPYQDLFDFTARMGLYRINRHIIENLINAGALDLFKANRATLLASMEAAQRYAQIVQINNGDNISLNLGLVSKPELVQAKETRRDRILKEKEALGFTLGNDEILSVKKYLHIHDPSIAAILDSYGQTVQSFGQIVSVIPKTSKSGRAYCRLLVSDGMSDVTINVWPSDYAQLKDSLAPGIYVRFHGKMGDNGAVQADKLATVHRE